MNPAKNNTESFIVFCIVLLAISLIIPFSGIIAMICKVVLLALSYAASSLAFAFLSLAKRDPFGLLPPKVSYGPQFIASCVYYLIVLFYCIYGYNNTYEYESVTFIILFIIAIPIKSFASGVAKQVFSDIIQGRK